MQLFRLSSDHCKFICSPSRGLPCLLQRAQGELEQLHGAHSVLVGRMRCIEGSEQACRWGAPGPRLGQRRTCRLMHPTEPFCCE